MKITVYLAASANGLISNKRNVPDWLSEEYGQGFMDISQQTKAVIMGKTTYNILAPDYLPLKNEGPWWCLHMIHPLRALSRM